MTNEELNNRNNRAQSETLVISRTDDGFRVYNPANPTKSYTVGGGPDAPTCTCPDFQYHEGHPNWRCKHILTVNQVGGPMDGDTYATDERLAIQAEGLPAPELPTNGNGHHQMVIKRSVSPDRRIDSLSVEFSCPLGSASSDDEIRSQAAEVLKLQDKIVKTFLGTNGKEAPAPAAAPGNGGNGPAPAQMVGVGGINTKWGRRLYIAIETNGSKLKLFGSRKQLADALVSAGYPQLAEHIDEGKALNVSCRVVTRPSEDGRYVNVEQVLPAEERPARRAW